MAMIILFAAVVIVVIVVVVAVVVVVVVAGPENEPRAPCMYILGKVLSDRAVHPDSLLFPHLIFHLFE